MRGKNIRLLIIKFYTALNLNAWNNSCCILHLQQRGTRITTMMAVAVEVYAPCVAVIVSATDLLIHIFYSFFFFESSRDHCAVIWTFLFTARKKKQLTVYPRAKIVFSSRVVWVMPNRILVHIFCVYRFIFSFSHFFWCAIFLVSLCVFLFAQNPRSYISIS